VIEGQYGRSKRLPGSATRSDRHAIVYRPAAGLTAVVAWAKTLSATLEARLSVADASEDRALSRTPLASPAPRSASIAAWARAPAVPESLRPEPAGLHDALPAPAPPPRETSVPRRLSRCVRRCTGHSG